MQVVATSGGQLIGFSEELFVKSLKYQQIETLHVNAYFICFDIL